MSEFVFKLPDLGEGTVEAEIVEWHVKPGDAVKEGDVIADVMTDKANIEVPAPVTGVVLRTTGEPGDVVAVGSELVAFETKGPAKGATPALRVRETEAVPRSGPVPGREARPERGTPVAAEHATSAAPPPEAPIPRAGGKVITSPAVRRRAVELGLDLAQVMGTGPRGRILRSDLEKFADRGGAPSGSRPAEEAAAPAPEPSTGGEADVERIKVIGVRRVIARRMAQSKSEIPHFAYVEEVDVTELESLRVHLNADAARSTRLTLLPFVALAIARAVPEHPGVNATFDRETGVLSRYRSVHLGIATQTPDGLKVPVVRHLERHDLDSLASEIGRMADAARSNALEPAALTGSTLTITSLGRMGGVVTTPVINYPEVAIVGVNKAVKRPVVVDDTVAVRLMMNLSSSFDHRFVDGFDAAAFVQRLRSLLEHPATLFMRSGDS